MRISDWSSDVCSSDLCTSIEWEGTRINIVDTPGRKFHILTAKRVLHVIRGQAVGCKFWRVQPNAHRRPRLPAEDRKSVVKGKSVSVRVYLGGRSIVKKKQQHSQLSQD